MVWVSTFVRLYGLRARVMPSGTFKFGTCSPGQVQVFGVVDDNFGAAYISF